MRRRCKPDFVVTGGGSIYLLTPVTAAGKEWAEEHIDTSELVRWGSSIPVEHRFIYEIVEGIVRDGLTIR